MKTLFMVIFGLIVVGIVIATIVVTVDLIRISEYSDVRLSFRTFRKFYAIASEKYECYWNYISYRDNEHCGVQNITMKTPIDHARYILWQHQKDRREGQAVNAKATQKYLDCVRKDIENYKDGDTESNS